MKNIDKMESYTKKKFIKRFNPNKVGQAGKLFGLPFDYDTSEIVVIPVPWDVTASFKDGASTGPKAILNVSSQIDLYLERMPDAWELGISMLPIEDEWIKKNNQAREYSTGYINHLEGKGVHLTDEHINLILKNINTLSEKINVWVYTKSLEILNDGKIPVVLGGDHSSPLGLMRAIAQSNDNVGVLQIDAHADLRPFYMGFKNSHASIMHNILKVNEIDKLIQLGVRDLCKQEADIIKKDDRIFTFFDSTLARERYEGRTWSDQVNQIIEELPENLYITFDIDGLERQFCPSTGTPVPGGLSYNQVIYLFDRIAESGKKILAFDICEVSGSDDQWDAIVGSRLLYYLSNITAASQKLLSFV